jgi:excinuclease ABC subunit A
VIQALAESGNTVVIIEHNLDVIKQADWIIDLGPEGGDGGGRIVAAGTPEDVAGVAGSYTGRFLKGALGKTKTRVAGKAAGKKKVAKNSITKSPAITAAAKAKTKAVAKSGTKKTVKRRVA